MKPLKISIITPSFNQGQFLEETIKSVINQNYPNLEYIIIDGGSTDNSIDIIKKYEKYISYWVSEKDSGQSEAINKGFQKATGDIITWLNSDDRYREGTLTKVSDYFEQFPDIGLIHGGVIVEGQKNQVVDFGYDDCSIERYLAGMAFPQPATFFKTNLLHQVGYLNENYHYGMDYDLFAQMALVSSFRKVPDIFTHYKLHPQSKSIKNYNLFTEEWIEIFIKMMYSLELYKIIEILKDMKVFEYYLEKSKNEIRRLSTQQNINERKMLFFFLSYVLRGWYASGKFYECKIILKYITKEYPQKWIVNEKGIAHIQKILQNIPINMLKIWRKLKS